VEIVDALVTATPLLVHVTVLALQRMHFSDPATPPRTESVGQVVALVADSQDTGTTRSPPATWQAAHVPAAPPKPVRQLTETVEAWVVVVPSLVHVAVWALHLMQTSDPVTPPRTVNAGQVVALVADAHVSAFRESTVPVAAAAAQLVPQAASEPAAPPPNNP